MNRKQVNSYTRQVNSYTRMVMTAVVLLITSFVAAAPATKVRVIERLQADSMKTVPVAYNGRVCPLNSVARDFTVKLTGSASFQGLTPEQVLLSWAEYPEEWKDVPMVRVKKGEVKERLGITTSKACFSDFFDKEGNYRLPNGEFPEIEERLILVAELTRGTLFTLLPRGAVPDSRINAEIIYNAVPWTLILFISCFLLAFVRYVLKVARKERKRVLTGMRIFKLLLTVLLLISLAIRWYISEHVPLTNTYETLLVVALTALIVSRFTTKGDTAPLLVAASTLLVAHIGELDPQVTPLMPALQSPWLSTHVSTIMISYTLFALLLFRPDRTMLICADLLLATGIILGSVWAKDAWGSYWSWDPKETWALISLIVYIIPLLPLHWLKKEKHQKIYLRFAFLTILMTYFGCNYLLTGMHSYAN